MNGRFVNHGISFVTKINNSNNQNGGGIVNVVTSAFSLRLLEGQPEHLGAKGYEVTVISSPGQELSHAQRAGLKTVALPMAREISPLRDLVAFWRLLRAMIQLRPIIANAATPKAGLLAGLAAAACRVPCRYYTLAGLRCETARGLKRRLLVLAERMACRCAHRVICVSESLRQQVIELGIVETKRTVVLASGSCCGVDAARFAPSAERATRAAQIRQTLGIPADAPVIGFVGRLTKDKGLSELVQAYLKLRARISQLKLLIVGPMEDGDPLPPTIRNAIATHPGIVHTGFVQDPVNYYHVMDVLALPTYREGFPTVVLEAHAAGKPIVSTRATGMVDAVIDGVTGVLVPVGDADALAGALGSVLRDRSLAARLGAAGRERVLREFRQEVVLHALAQQYQELLQEKGLASPAGSVKSMTEAEFRNGPVFSR